MVMIMSSYAVIFEQNPVIEIHPVVKNVLAILLGATMTVGLLIVMCNLIKNDAMPREVPPAKPIPSLNYDPPIIKTIFENPQAPVKPVYEPKPIIERNPEPIKTGVLNTKPILSTVTEIKEKFIPVIDSSHILPMVKVNPNYPQAAATRGIEGFVDVMFDVTETGSTQNIEVVYAEPENIFNSAVIKAVSRWKYKAKMEDGVAVKVFGVRERIRFNLDN